MGSHIFTSSSQFFDAAEPVPNAHLPPNILKCKLIISQKWLMKRNTKVRGGQIIVHPISGKPSGNAAFAYKLTSKYHHFKASQQI
jgi:hypothetical protein